MRRVLLGKTTSQKLKFYYLTSNVYSKKSMMKKIYLSITLLLLTCMLIGAKEIDTNLNAKKMQADELGEISCGKFAIEITNLIDEEYHLSDSEYLEILDLVFKDCANAIEI